MRRLILLISVGWLPPYCASVGCLPPSRDAYAWGSLHAVEGGTTPGLRLFPWMWEPVRRDGLDGRCDGDLLRNGPPEARQFPGHGHHPLIWVLCRGPIKGRLRWHRRTCAFQRRSWLGFGWLCQPAL